MKCTKRAENFVLKMKFQSLIEKSSKINNWRDCPRVPEFYSYLCFISICLLISLTLRISIIFKISVASRYLLAPQFACEEYFNNLIGKIWIASNKKVSMLKFDYICMQIHNNYRIIIKTANISHSWTKSFSESNFPWQAATKQNAFVCVTSVDVCNVYIKRQL